MCIRDREWLDSFDAVTRFNGSNVSSELIQRLTDHAREQGVRLPAAITTPFKNTINPEDERVMPGDLFMERRIRSLIRWNAMAMVMRANDNEDGLGGHISSFSSSATLYDVGLNYFFRGTGNGHPHKRLCGGIDLFVREIDGKLAVSYTHLTLPTRLPV